MFLSLNAALFLSPFFIAAYLFYRRVSQMAKAGSPLFKVGYFFYTKTRIGHYYYRKEVRKAQRKYNNQPHSSAQEAVFNGLSILPIPLSLDNYCYLVREQGSGTAILIDPADPQPVLQVLQSLNVTPTAILTTHKHWDHSGGNAELRKSFKKIPVYGGRLDSVPGASHLLDDGDRVDFGGGLCFTVLHTPGHTVGHIVYVLDGSPYQAPHCLFCGDHLFLAGIGRMFEGTAATMLSSLDKVVQLPDETLVWPGHEYAKDNLRFAQHINPTNQAVVDKLAWAEEKHKEGCCSSPSTIGEEKMYNPFLRTDSPELLQELGLDKEEEGDERRAKVLACLRERKDKFQYKL